MSGWAVTSVPVHIREQLRDSASWRLLGLLFERPRAGWLEEIDLLAREIGDPSLSAAALEARRATEGEYLKALGPGGQVSPREVAYRTMEDPSRLLADLSALYEAFAYHPRAEDPPDHIAVEAGFAGYLLLKEAMARLADDAEAAETTARAREHFIEERLRPFAAGLAGRLEGSASWLEPSVCALLKRVAAWHDLPLHPERSTLRMQDVQLHEGQAAACAADLEEP